MKTIEEKIFFKRKYLTNTKKFKKRKRIKSKPPKKAFKYKFKFIIYILIFILLLFFISKKIYEKLYAYPQDDLTLVSAYYKISKSKHSSKDYLKWIANFAKLNKSMVYFTNKEFMPIFKEMRPKNLHHKTVFIELEFEEFYAYKNLYNQFKETYKIDPERRIHSVRLYIIWAEKCTFLKKAIKQNYFNSKCFYWVDSGYFRESENGMEKYINNWPSTKKCFEDDRVIIGQIRGYNALEQKKIVNFDKYTHRLLRKSFNVAGGFFGGQIKNSLKFIDLYYNSIRLFNENNIFIGKDQNIFTYMAFAHPEIIKLIKLRSFMEFKNILYYE